MFSLSRRGRLPWLVLSQSLAGRSLSFLPPRDAEHLRAAWSRLDQRFQQIATKEGQFPLFANSAASVTAFGGVPTDPRHAAVLVLICSVDGQASILFTKRASNLSNHAGEISFPGGHFEPESDANLHATAIREAEEELVPPSWFSDQISIVGETTSLPSLRGTPVTPVVGVLWSDLTHETLSTVFPGSPDEVDVVFAVPIATLMEVESTRPLPENRFRLKKGPIFETESGTIWGLTAYILRPLMRNLLVPVFVSKS